MTRFNEDGRPSGAEPGGADGADRGKGGFWLDRARALASARVDQAGRRASQAASTGHTWSAQRPPTSAEARHGPISEHFLPPDAPSGPTSSLPRAEPPAHPDAARSEAVDPGGESFGRTRPAPARQDAEPGSDVSDALARHGNDAFAARGRLAAHQAGAQRRRRIWDMDEAPSAYRPAEPAPPPDPYADGSGGDVYGEPEPAPDYDRAPQSRARGDWLDRIDRPAPAPERSPERRSERSLDPQPGSPREASPRAAPSPLAPRPAAPARAAAPDGAPHDARPQAADDDIAYARAQLAKMAHLGPEAEDAAAPGGRHAAPKTRVLGFHAPDPADDPFAKGGSGRPHRGPDFPVGWLIVMAGAGRGASFALTDGVATLGRGDDQTVILDFGDTSISRSAHASIAFDDETRRFFLGAGPKSNLVRLNGRPVLATEELGDGDTIRLGETELRFVALCGDSFAWAGPETDPAA